MKTKDILKKVYFLSFFLSASLSFGQTWEVYDAKLNLKNRLLYQDITLLSEDVRIGKTEEGLYLLNSSFQKSVPLEGNEVYQYLAPWILVKNDLGIGTYHEYGQQVLELKYDEVEVFFNLLLARKGNEYWVYERGKGTLRPLGTLDEASIGSRGQIITKRNGQYFLPLTPISHQAFDLIQDNDGDYLLAKNQNGYGLINMEGKVVLDLVIDTLAHTRGNFYYGYDEDQYLLVEGDPIKANVRYNSFHQITYEDGLMLEYIHGKLRRVMKEDGILLDAIGMTKVDLLEKDLYSIKYRDDKLGLLGRNGWLVTPTDSIAEIKKGSNGFFPAMSPNGKWGFLNPSGEWMINPIFEEVKAFENEFAPFRKGNYWGLIDKFGNERFSPEWDEISISESGIALAKKSGKAYFLGLNGNKIEEDGFEKICRLSNGSLLVKKGDKIGLISNKGEVKLDPLFDSLVPEGRIGYQASMDGKSGLISEAGETLIPIAYEAILYDEFENLILAKSAYEPVIIIEEENGKKKRKKGQ